MCLHCLHLLTVLGILGYYLPSILGLVGITNTQQQLGINLGMTIVSWIFTIVGSAIIDRVTRRLLLMSTLCVFIFFLAMISISGGLFDSGLAAKAMGILTIVWIFLFQIASSMLCTSPV